MPAVTTNPIQWIAVCGGTGGVPTPWLPQSQAELRALEERIKQERAQIAALARRLLASGKLGGRAANFVSALVLADLVKDSVDYHPDNPGPLHVYAWLPSRWVGRRDRYKYWKIRRLGRWFSILVTDIAGKKHLVPKQSFTALGFLQALERLVFDPAVAQVEVRAYGNEQGEGFRLPRTPVPMDRLWGRIIVAKRYANVDALLKGLQPPPSKEGSSPVVATGPAQAAWQAAERTPSGISGTSPVSLGKIDPKWVLAGGAGLLVLALLMRR